MNSDPSLEESAVIPPFAGGPGTPRWLGSVLPNMFSSLRYRNYRLFFIGQIISNMGTWIQQPVMQWLVWQMTHSKGMLGVLAAVGSIPITLLSPVGGLAAEHFQKRRVLLVTQALLFVAPVTLAIAMLINYQMIQPWHLFAVAIFSGAIMAFDIPSRQSFVVDMVGRTDMPNAIALNSFVFNLSRMLGPILGVLLMDYISPAACFAANGLSYLALVTALMMMTMRPRSEAQIAVDRQRVHHPLGGFLYAWNQKDLRVTILLLAATTIFGWSLTSQLAAFAEEVFGLGAKGYGLLLTVFGAGALVGALTMAYLARAKNRRRLILAGEIIFVISVTAFIWSPIFWVALVPVFFAGLGLLVNMAGINSHIQMEVSHRFHGRIMGVFAMFFGGVMPIGAILTGYMAEMLSLRMAAQINIAALALVTLFAAMSWKRWKPGALSKEG